MTLRETHERTRSPNNTRTHKQQQHKQQIWTLEEQIAQLKEALSILADAATEGQTLLAAKSELQVLDSAGLVEAHIYNAENCEAIKNGGTAILTPKQYAEFSSDVGPCHDGLAITGTPHFLTETIVDWCKADKQLVMTSSTQGEAELRAKMRSLEAQLETARAAAAAGGSGSKASSQRVAYLESAVAEKDEEVLQLRTLVSNMQCEVAAASDKYVDATSSSRRINELETLMTEAKSVLEEKVRENDSLKSQVRSLEIRGGSADSASRERAQLQGKVAELESTLAAVVREAEDKSREVGNLRMSSERLERMSTEAQEQLRQKEEELNRLRTMGASSQAQAAQLAQLRGRVSELEMLLEAKEEAFSNVEAVAQESASRQNQYSSSLQRQVEDLKRELVLAQTALSSKQAENDGYHARMSQLQRRCDDLEASRQSAHDEVLAARARTKQLETTLSSLDHEKDELQRESAEHGGKAKMLVTKIKELQASLDGKGRELQEAQEMRKDAVLVAARLKRSSTKASDDCQKLREQISQMGGTPRV